jgi:hypothetical protein
MSALPSPPPSTAGRTHLDDDDEEEEEEEEPAALALPLSLPRSAVTPRSVSVSERSDTPAAVAAGAPPFSVSSSSVAAAGDAVAERLPLEALEPSKVTLA